MNNLKQPTLYKTPAGVDRLTVERISGVVQDDAGDPDGDGSKGIEEGSVDGCWGSKAKERLVTGLELNTTKKGHIDGVKNIYT